MKLIDRLIKRIDELKAPVVVGLDPQISSIDAEYEGDVLRFNKDIIDAIKDIVPAVKPQIAFYEALGVDGIKIYYETCKYAKAQGLFVIADVKRGDIGSTSLAYSNAYLTDVFESDFATINPYLGADSTDEFIKNVDKNDKGVFVLVKTSNPSSSQIQDLETTKGKVYEVVADLTEQYSVNRVGSYGYSPIGSVIGATHPSELKQLRHRLKTSFLLIPGYGAQGGTAKDIVSAFDEHKRGAIVNSSRGIIFAKRKESETRKEASRRAALEMIEDIRSVLYV